MYPEVKDDVSVIGKNFTYASEGVQLKCTNRRARQRQPSVHSKCLANSTWSARNFSCSGKIVVSRQVWAFILMNRIKSNRLLMLLLHI